VVQLPIKPGDAVVADFGELGRVGVTIAPQGGVAPPQQFDR
jgi:hypothetical protein